MSGKAGIWILLGGIACTSAGAPAGVWAQDRGFAETTEVVAVEVPVQVLRDGEPVRGLTAADFEVYEGRRKLPVTGFEVLDLTESAAPAPAQAGFKPAKPIAARRHFLLLFDLAFSSPKALAQAQNAARDLVQGLHPVDLVAIASYTPSKGPELLLGFTGDKAQIANALGMLAKPEMFSLAQPDFHKEVSSMLADVPVAEWKNYLRFQLLEAASR